VAIYEPNMARVEVEDRKGLEVVLLLSAEIIRDLYLAPRSDPFNTAGAPPPTHSNGAGGGVAPVPKAVQKRPTAPPSPGPVMSGAIGDSMPSSSGQPPRASSSPRKDDIEAEKRKVAALVEQEQEKARERDRRDKEEQKHIREMLEREEEERIRKMLEREAREEQAERDRRQRQIDAETERLRREYGVGPDDGDGNGPGRGRLAPASPRLPPRPGTGGVETSGAAGGRPGPSTEAPPQPPRPRPQSVGPPVGGSSSLQTDHVYSQQQQNGESSSGSGGGRRHKLGQFLQNSPYAGRPAATVSGFFGVGGNSNKEDEKKKKVKKKRSVHF
jgi:hypothetical protein